MYKLGLDDIEIKSPGKQVTGKIIKEFGDIDVFLRKIHIRKDTVIVIGYAKN